MYTNIEETLLTGRNIETLFSISPNTRQRWTKNGVLKPIRINSRKFLYRMSDIRQLMLDMNGGAQ
jgi:predicted site-specific integrase-resolvase